MTPRFAALAVTLALLACGPGCTGKRPKDRTMGDDIGEAGASSGMAGASGEAASGGRAGHAGRDDAGAGGGSGAGGSQPDASADSPDAAAPPELPGPTPEIDGEGSLPIGIWIGETPEPFGAWSFGCAVARISSPRITLSIASMDGSDRATGTIIFGANTAVPPVDPEREYPPGVSEERASCLRYSVLEGFPYALHDGRVDASGRFHFRVAVAEPYEAWCSGQTSLPFSEETTGYSCLPYGLPRYPADCVADPECAMSLPKYALCRGTQICACVREGCAANLNVSHRFDLEVSSDTMRGIISPVATDYATVEVILRKVR